jgi:hypothetical protein
MPWNHRPHAALLPDPATTTHALRGGCIFRTFELSSTDIQEANSPPLPWHSLSPSSPFLCAALQEGSPCRCLPHRAHTSFKAGTSPLEQPGAQGPSNGSDAALHCLPHLSGAETSLSLSSLLFSSSPSLSLFHFHSRMEMYTRNPPNKQHTHGHDSP